MRVSRPRKPAGSGATEKPPEWLIQYHIDRVKDRCVRCGARDCKLHEEENKMSERSKEQWASGV